MIAVDTNILVYAHREETPQHHGALHWLTRLAEGARSLLTLDWDFARFPKLKLLSRNDDPEHHLS